ncbi:SurA N-terminal domain-containing protein [Granulicella sibirica]|uniref:PpiC-type peptidyl-prolyl cis-trans isomerase n=1 Tax=Granulicella sibirica TaxID=2479048 RepID=A0A4Q0TA33_9BACT|nr:SurA N-terminal domain-containing protein [Granulicella sibirica]RXH58859.1 PpiC-type peptidyl-prolyl cis-trans isomerase [Granulicella sibirica]
MQALRIPRTHAPIFLGLSLLPILLFVGCKTGHNADVVATVNGKAIMQSDLDKTYQAALGDPQQPAPTGDQAESLKLNAMRELIDEEIVEQRAAKMNLTASNEEVDAKLTEMKAPFTEEVFAQRLRDSKDTIDDLRRKIRRSLTIERLINKEITSKITVTDNDVSNYYNQHKAEFNLMETQYHLAQIQVTNQPSQQAGNLQGSKASNDDEARKKIEALKARLDTGEDFGTLAMNFSERPETASSGGDMGFVGDTSMHADPNAYAAITKLKAGQITDILPLLADPQTKKPAGYAIYKLISREPAGQRELSDPRVQQAIREQLRQGRSQLLKNAYFEMLRDQARIENFYAEQIFKNDAH